MKETIFYVFLAFSVIFDAHNDKNEWIFNTWSMFSKTCPIPVCDKSFEKTPLSSLLSGWRYLMQQEMLVSVAVRVSLWSTNSKMVFYNQYCRCFFSAILWHREKCRSTPDSEPINLRSCFLRFCGETKNPSFLRYIILITTANGLIKHHLEN